MFLHLSELLRDGRYLSPTPKRSTRQLRDPHKKATLLGRHGEAQGKATPKPCPHDTEDVHPSLNSLADPSGWLP